MTPAPQSLSHEHEPTGCRWIEGDPSHGPWRYCQTPTRQGSSYCPTHHARVWKPSEKKEAAS